MRSEHLRGNLYFLTQHLGFHWNGPWLLLRWQGRAGTWAGWGKAGTQDFLQSLAWGLLRVLAFWTSGVEEHVQVISSKFNFMSLEFSILGCSTCQYWANPFSRRFLLVLGQTMNSNMRPTWRMQELFHKQPKINSSSVVIIFSFIVH
jgi:hypothetical protein